MRRPPIGPWSRCGVIVVMCKTHRARPLWEREMDLQLSRQLFLCWAGTPNQHRQSNRLHRQMLIGVAQRELSRPKGEGFLVPVARVARRTLTVFVITALRCSRTGPSLGTKPPKACGVIRENQRSYHCRRGMFIALSGRPAADQASAFIASPHDLDRRGSWTLVPTNLSW